MAQPIQGKLPPHSLEAEQGVLGCALLGGDQAVADVVAACSPESFYDLRNRAVFLAVAEMRDRRAPVDLLTLSDKMKAAGTLEEVGGLSYLMGLPQAVPSAANLGYYLEIVREKQALRKLVQTCLGAVSRVYEFDGEVAQLVDEFGRDALKVGEVLDGRKDGPADLKRVQLDVIDGYDRAAQGKDTGAVRTGFPDLDYMLGGIRGKQMHVVSARPSVGKSTLVLNIALNACRQGVKVSFNSYETGRESIVHRAHCALAPVAGMGLVRGNATEGEIVAVQAGIDAFAKVRDMLLVRDEPANEAALFANARRDYQAGARLFVVDYLQQIECGGKTLVENCTRASKAVKRLAQELDCPVLVVASMNRDVEGRPTLRNLRESGQIESDADSVMLMHCPKEGDEHSDVREVCCEVAKNRGGPTGDVPLTLFAAQFRFESAARREEP